MYLAENRILRLATLCALYVAQGIPFGFVTITLKAYLTKQGVAPGDIGTLMAMTSWPWMFKFLWGPLIDTVGIRSMGRRRPWILLAQTGMIFTLAAMAVIPDLTTAITLLVVSVALHNVFASVQDVSVDALAVDLLPAKERGRAAGLMYGASYLGTWFGGHQIGAVAARSGIQASVVVMLVAVGLIMLLPALVRERRGDAFLPARDERDTAGGAEGGDGSFRVRLSGFFAALAQAFRVPSAWVGAVYALLFKLAPGVLVVVPIIVLKEQYAWDTDAFREIEANGSMLGLGGSVVGGFLASWVGARRTATAGAAALAALWCWFAVSEPSWHDPSIVRMYLWGDGFLQGFVSVTSFAVFMSVSNPLVAATQFTSYMAVLNLSMTVGQKLGGVVAEARLALPDVLVACAVFQVALTVLLFWMKPREEADQQNTTTRPLRPPV